MTPLVADLLGIGLWIDGLEGWPRALRVLRDGAIEPSPVPLRPVAEVLAPAERRRAPEGVAVALHVAHEAVTMASTAAAIDLASLASVFASAHGDLAIVDYLCTTLADDPLLLSPTRFHHSVHNAAAGYWSIATQALAASTSLAAGDDTFAAGLVDALAQVALEGRPVLFVAFDTPATGPLAEAVANTRLFGMAMLLAPPGERRSLVSLRAEVVAGRAPLPLPAQPGLHALATSSAAARGLALAEAVALEAPATLNYPVGGGSTLKLETRLPSPATDPFSIR